MHSASDSPGPGSTDRRSSERVLVMSTAMIEAASGAKQRFTAQVIDVSTRGMQLKVRQPFDRGSMIRIDLPSKQLGPVTTVLACIMRCSPDDEGCWRIGCTFCTELDDEDLEAMGIKRQKPPANEDQRSWTRYPAQVRVNYRGLSSPNQPEHVAEVLNASPSGIGLMVKEPLDPGTLLDLTVKNSTGKDLFEILACVVYRHVEPDSQYSIGCNFIRDLSEKELKGLC